MSITLREFLYRNCKLKSDGKYTHTSMGVKSGSYYVSKEMTSDFLDIYEKDVFEHGVPTHINEVPDPNRHSPFKVDFDFTYKMELSDESSSEDENDNDRSDIDDIDPDGDGSVKLRKKKKKKKRKIIPERRYNNLMIDELISEFGKLFNEWCVTPMPDEQRQCFILEKKSPRFKDKNKLIVKDGFHLMWPYFVCPFSFQQKIRTIMLKRIRKCGIFNNMELMNSLKDAYDQGIIEGNWLMYGSCKQDKKGKIGKPYLLTRIVKYDYDEEMDEYGITPIKIDKMHYTNGMLIRLFSIRMREDNYATLKLEKIKEIEALELKSSKIREDKRLRKLAHKSTNAHRSDEDLQIIFGLIDILNVRRADNYQEWIQLIWCCYNIHNTDERLLEKVIEFSKKSEKYKDEAEESCREKWNESSDGGLGEGSLHMWAKEDNYTEYKEVFRISIWGKIRKCAVDNNFNPYDVADITYDMYQHQYVCVDTDKNIWYKFNNHRWSVVKGPTCLKKNLSTVIFEFFCQKPQEFMTDNEIDPKIWGIVAKNSAQLKQTSFKNNVIKECQQFFDDPESKFLENLDENRYLIAFKNGILDLGSDELIFRDGRPDDNISFSTKTEYNPDLTWDHPLVCEVMKFFEQIQPNEENREYLLTLSATMLDGSVNGEKFYIFTGSGGNGKGVYVTMMNNALGDYSGELPVQILTSKRSKPGEATAETARLKGTRAVFAQEPEEGVPINASVLKQFSGGDEVTARLLFGNPITFIPQWTIVACCNDLPPLPPMDGGVWRRVRVLNFGSRFVDNPDPNDPNQFLRDSSLKEKIPYLTEAFIWILVQYYKKYKIYGISEPRDVTQVTRDYQEELDKFQGFINKSVMKSQNFINGPERILLKEAHIRYKAWMDECYEDEHPMNQGEFKKIMEKKFNKKYHEGDALKF
jgi:P4 family phage/plasmid primase-like protien